VWPVAPQVAVVRHKGSPFGGLKKKFMATATLSGTLNTPISELRLAPMERILVIEDDGTLRRFCGGFSPRKGMRSTLPPMPFVVWRDFAKEYQPQGSSIYLARDLQDAVFARKLRI